MNDKVHLEQLNQQLKELTSIYRGAVAHAGISENEFWIWYTLIELGGEYSQQDLRGMWSMSKQTVNSIITNMVQKEFVVLEVVPGTRNWKIVRLTESGKLYGESLVAPIAKAEQRTFDRIPEEELAMCSAILSRFITLLRDELQNE